jgi:hypothetical protein
VGANLCSFYPVISAAYNQCAIFRDSTTIAYGSYPFTPSSRICNPTTRSVTIPTYQGYTSGSYCGLDYLNHRLQLAAGSQYDTVMEVKFQLDTRGCTEYIVDSVIINGVRFGNSILQQTNGIYTVDLTNNTTPIPGFFDGLDDDGFIDATNTVVNISWQVNRQGVATNTCVYPTFKAFYRLCFSGEFRDSLLYSGQVQSARINQPVYPISNIALDSFSYTAPSYCSNGYIDYKVDVVGTDTLGGFRFVLNSINCNMYDVDTVYINGVPIFGSGLSVNAQRRWTVDLGSNTTPIPGFYNSGKDGDGFIDEFSSVVSIRVVIRLKCRSDSTCSATGDLCYRPDAQLFFDRCFGEVPDTVKNCNGDNTGSSGGVCTQDDLNGPRNLLMADRKGYNFATNSPMPIGDQLDDDVTTTPYGGGNLHTLIYDYTHFGIARCPNDTQLILKVCMNDTKNKHHADSIRSTQDSAFFGSSYYRHTDITPTEWLALNPGYVGHRYDTVVESGDTIVCLYLYLKDQVVTPENGTNNIPLKFVTNGWGDNFPCVPYPLDLTRPLGGRIQSKELIYTCRQSDGTVCCQFKRTCVSEIPYLVGGVRERCPWLVNVHQFDVSRISLGYQDSTLSAFANPGDDKSIMADCDTVRVSTKVSFNFDTALSTFIWVLDQSSSGTPRFSDPLDFLNIDTVYFVTVNNTSIGVPSSCISRTTRDLGNRIVDTFRLDIPCVTAHPEIAAGDSLYFFAKYKVNTNQAPPVCNNNLYNYQFHISYPPPDFIGVRRDTAGGMIVYETYYHNQSEVGYALRTDNYSIAYYNQPNSTEVFADHNTAVQGCKIDVSSYMVNNCVSGITDRFPTEFRPQYYLDSIVLNFSGLRLDSIPNGTKLRVGGGINYTIGSQSGDIISISHPTQTSTRVVLHNSGNQWPIQEDSYQNFDTLYVFNMSLEYDGCCYQIADDAYYNINY